MTFIEIIKFVFKHNLLVGVQWIKWLINNLNTILKSPDIVLAGGIEWLEWFILSFQMHEESA